MNVRDFPTLAEMRVMQILQDAPKGLYGLQIVERSNGVIKRGSVYVLLGRLEEKGFIKVSRTQAAADYPGLPRPLYRLNAHGAHVLTAAQTIGMLPVGVIG